MNTALYVNASQRQYTPAGDLLGKMYYGGFLDKVLMREEYSGYPHNGGEHTLSLRMEPTDLFSFLALVGESFPSHEGTAAFIASVKANFSKRYPSHTCA